MDELESDTTDAPRMLTSEEAWELHVHRMTVGDSGLGEHQESDDEGHEPDTSSSEEEKKVWEDGIVEDLELAIEYLQADLRRCHPRTQRADAPALVEAGWKLHAELVAQRKQSGEARKTDEAAALLLQRLEAAREQLLVEHKKQVLLLVRQELAQMTHEAQGLEETFDADVLRLLERAMSEFEERLFIAQPDDIEKPMAHLREALNYARQAHHTRAKRLPIEESALQTHVELCGAERVGELLARMQPGRLASLEPGPMGSATPAYDFKDYPQVEVVENDGLFRLQKTSAKDSAMHRCTVMPIGEFVLGEIFFVVPGKSASIRPGNSDALLPYKLPQAEESWVGKLLKRGVTDTCYREVELRELEHLVDFDHAFKVGPVALADVVNELAGAGHEQASGPIKALIEALRARGLEALIPDRPKVPQAWVERMTLVMEHLAGMSKLRDSRGTHSPTGNVCEVRSDAVIIRPLFSTESLDTASIISLKAVPVAYSGDPDRLDDEEPEPQLENEPVEPQEPPNPERPRGPVRPFQVGDTGKTFARIRGLDVHEQVGGEQVDGGVIQMDTEVRIEALADAGRSVWVSVPQGQAQTSGMPDGRAYFLLSVDQLD